MFQRLKNAWRRASYDSLAELGEDLAREKAKSLPLHCVNILPFLIATKHMPLAHQHAKTMDPDNNIRTLGLSTDVVAFEYGGDTFKIKLGVIYELPSGFDSFSEWVHSIDGMIAITECVEVTVNDSPLYSTYSRKEKHYTVDDDRDSYSTISFNAHNITRKIEDVACVVNYATYDERYRHVANSAFVKYVVNCFPEGLRSEELNVLVCRALFNNLESGFYLDEDLRFYYSQTIPSDAKSIMAYYKSDLVDSVLTEAAKRQHMEAYCDDVETLEKYTKLYNI